MRPIEAATEASGSSHGNLVEHSEPARVEEDMQLDEPSHETVDVQRPRLVDVGTGLGSKTRT